MKGSIQLEGAKMHESFMLYKVLCFICKYLFCVQRLIITHTFIHVIFYIFIKSEEMEVKKISSYRKLMFHSTTDYDDAGANPKHDPRRRPGGKP